MRTISLLTRANLRKSKRQVATLTLLLFVAATLLNVGLAVLLGFPSAFDDAVEELNASEAQVFISNRLWDAEVIQVLEDNTEEYEAVSGLFLAGDIPWRDDTLSVTVVFADMSEQRSLSQWMVVGETLPLTANSAFVPYLFRPYGYELGDLVTFTLEGEKLEFVISGFFENIYTELMALPRTILVPDARFAELAETFGEFQGQVISVNGVGNYRDLGFLLDEATDRASTVDARYILGVINLDGIRANRMTMSAMLAVMAILVTLVIAAVSLLVTRFRIRNSIEEEMPKIGSLQAVGYTSRQITRSVIVQYGAMALGAALASILPAFLLLPALSSLLATQSGLSWEPGFDPIIYLATAVGLTLVLIIVARLAARSIRRITPVAALRGGTRTHSFKRNHLPLSRTRLSLTSALAGKSVLQSARQSLMMLVVFASASLTAVIALVMFYNSSVDLTAFEVIPGIERANAGVVFRPEEDVHALREEVVQHPDVRDAQFLDITNIVVSDTFVSAIVMDDYDRRVTRNVFDGIFPRYDNEIAISGLLANYLDVRVGDEVGVGRENQPFLITGLVQGMEAGSTYAAYLTIEGMRSVNPGFRQSVLMIYLLPGTDAAEFTEQMDEQFAAHIFAAFDGDAQFAEGVSSFAAIFSAVGIAILVISAFVILLVLHFVIGSAIVRRHRELGIYKAIGFTTGSLMNQMTLSLAAPMLFGTALGIAAGMLVVNPLMALGMGAFGIMEGSFLVNTGWMIAAGVAIVMIAYLIAVAVTSRIRKISAYELITE
ncbi:MAG: ABC transporter permease [Promicromonosporaceae bacterium]|nr:ABC transporter permease [Promicromonosporaceae bacterium]